MGDKNREAKLKCPQNTWCSLRFPGFVYHLLVWLFCFHLCLLCRHAAVLFIYFFPSANSLSRHQLQVQEDDSAHEEAKRGLVGVSLLCTFPFNHYIFCCDCSWSLIACVCVCRLRSALPQGRHHAVQADRHQGHVLQSGRLGQSPQHHAGALHWVGQSGEIVLGRQWEMKNSPKIKSLVTRV